MKHSEVGWERGAWDGQPWGQQCRLVPSSAYDDATGGSMILITGATGNNGVEIIKRLARQGEQVRAMVREVPSSKEAFPSGIEYVIADFDDDASLRKALTGSNRAFLVTPSSEKVEEQQLRFVRVAQEAGAEHVVYLSQLHATSDSPVRFLRYHAVVEKALEQSRMAFTHLRPNLYMQSLLLFRALIVSKGVITAPVGDARVSIVDVRDIAEVAALALTQRGHEGKTYDITGPEALTHAEMASQLGAALGKPVRFADISPADMQAALSSFRMPRWQAEGLVEDYEHYHRGEAGAVSDSVVNLTGRSPKDFRTFAGDYRDMFLS